MSESANRLQQNLQAIQNRIADAAAKASRDPASVKLVAVTKYVSPLLATSLFEAGCSALGESRPQELCRKAEALSALPIEWHFIGHLQRNKIKRTLPCISLLHSLDSTRLAEAIAAEARLEGRVVQVLLEVNISGDPDKTGFSPIDIASALDTMALIPEIEVRGLMGMASRDGGIEVAEMNFAALRALRDELANRSPGVTLPELSMGMSGDFEAAIAHGATIVRVGSALFDGVVE